MSKKADQVIEQMRSGYTLYTNIHGHSYLQADFRGEEIRPVHGATMASLLTNFRIRFFTPTKSWSQPGVWEIVDDPEAERELMQNRMRS